MRRNTFAWGILVDVHEPRAAYHRYMFFGVQSVESRGNRPLLECRGDRGLIPVNLFTHRTVVSDIMIDSELSPCGTHRLMLFGLLYNADTGELSVYANGGQCIDQVRIPSLAGLACSPVVVLPQCYLTRVRTSLHAFPWQLTAAPSVISRRRTRWHEMMAPPSPDTLAATIAASSPPRAIGFASKQLTATELYATLPPPTEETDEYNPYGFYTS